MIIMKKTKKPYERPAVDVYTIGVQRCIALSVSGSTEDFTSTDPYQQMEGFDEINQGDF